jgi:hypothetical protein
VEGDLWYCIQFQPAPGFVNFEIQNPGRQLSVT